MTEQRRIYLLWKREGGPERMHVFQGIDKNSCVFDIGLYMGDWAAQICSRYNPMFYAFEPISKYFEKAKKRLSCFSPKVKLFNYGVGGFTRFETIVVKKDSSGIFASGDDKQKITIKSIEEVLEDLNIELVDLIGINIEGGEYELLENLISTGLIERFKQLFIQFHRIGPNWASRRKKIQEALLKTHILLYNYDYIWELWTSSK